MPFTVSPALRLVDEIAGQFGGLKLKLKPATPGFNCVVVEDLVSADQAREAFQQLKVGLLAAGLYTGCGVRVSDDLFEFDGSTPPSGRPGQAVLCQQGQQFLSVYFEFGDAAFIADRALPRFLEGLRAGITFDPVSLAMQDTQVRLASVLFTDSYFESSPQARFIGLMGVLEVLKDKESASSATQKLVTRWMDEVRREHPPEEQALLGQLGWLRTVSVGQGIRSMTRRHLGDEASRTATMLYRHRSTMVHDGSIPENLATLLDQAEILVRQLLAKIFSAGAR
ncbi:hypothetical protein [Frankia sp. CiP3]|uniref:hypothetical protein n=1 Tax=Frankia sp. CiP3 TaxID=2880971 RepID=UPI001EF72969|nr:hypothetical protein [Frankia sp. CiP3]